MPYTGRLHSWPLWGCPPLVCLCLSAHPCAQRQHRLNPRLTASHSLTSFLPLPSGLLDAYQLSDLQQYLQQYPASHYSHNGKEPLLYVVVLLLSLQFRWVGG